MKRYDFNLLAALEALLAEHSVSGAARRLGVGQPAMSAALARLRAQFDDQLLVRTRRGMEPTPRARALSAPLRDALAELRALADGPRPFDPQTARRTFRISGGDYVGMTFLPSLLAAIGNDAPAVDIRFRYLEKDALLDYLDREEIDLALAVLGGLPKRFASETLADETFVCACRVDHPILHEAMTPKLFASASHVLVTERGDEKGCLDELLERDGLSRRIAVTVPSVALVGDILRRTDLIATIAKRAGQCLAEDQDIALFDPPYHAAAWSMSMIWSNRSAGDAGLAWLRDKIRAAANATRFEAGRT